MIITWELARRLRERGLILPTDRDRYVDEQLYLLAVSFKDNYDAIKLRNANLDAIDDEIGFQATFAEFKDK